MIGIGCGVIALLAVAIIGGTVWWGARKASSFVEELSTNPAAAAEMIIKMHPEVDHVSTDQDNRTITVKNKKSGDLVTLNFEDIENGKFSIQGADGEDSFSIDSNSATDGITIRSGKDGEVKIGGAADLSDVPTWVPVYPNTLKSTTAMTRKSPQGKASGMVAFEVADDINTIAEYYRSALEEKGYEVNEQSINANGNVSQSMLNATHAGDGQTLNIIIGEAKGKRTLMINYEEK